MEGPLDPVFAKELGEAKAALARHGIVILRSVETDMEPAIMVAVRNSLASSPSKLRKLSEEELDELLTKARKKAIRSAKELASLHVQLLAKLGTEYIGDVLKELDGIDQLFRWERISKVAEPVSAMIEKEGFNPVSLSGPEDVSDAFRMELQEKWPPALERFRALAEKAVQHLAEAEPKFERTPKTPRGKRKKGRSK